MAGISRRDLLVWLGQAAVTTGALAVASGRGPVRAAQRKYDSIGLALGSGGAAGLSHITVLEALEELGICPSFIAGSSIGALVGGLFAAGNDSKTLKGIVTELVPEGFGSWLGAAFSRDRVSLIDLLRVDINAGSMLDQEAFREYLEGKIGSRVFEDLEVPLVVTATDFWEREPVIFDSGAVVPAIMASTALPGVFPPLRFANRILVDGGILNPVPYELIMDRVGITIAVEVLGRRKRPENGMPGHLDLVFNTFDIMQSNVIRAMRERCEPEIYLEPPLIGIRTLDFHRAQEIYSQAEPVKDELKRKLEELYNRREKGPGISR